MIQNYNNYYMFTPFLPPNCDKPPTIYQILESIVNGDEDLNEPQATTKIKDLPKQGRLKIFNFDYPLSTHVDKEDFECLILKHYMMRRINFDTVTAFRIMLDAKLNEIMPLYNKMFDALDGWNIFTDGEITTRTGRDDITSTNTTNKTSQSTDNTTSQETNNTTSNDRDESSKQSTNSTNNNLSTSSTTGDTTTSDRRMSNTPQNRITEVQNGEYLTQYNYDTNVSSGTDSSTSQGTAQSITNDTDTTVKNNTTNNTKNNTSNNTKNDTSTDVSNGTDNKIYTETITKTPSDKISIYKELQENIKSIYTLIFKDLDILFYGIY